MERKRSTRVRERMSSPPVTIGPEESLQNAIDLLRKRNIRELPVVQHGKLVGIVTDRDLKEISPSYPLFRDPEEIQFFLRNMKVAAAMTADPLIVSPEHTLVGAAKMLQTYRINSLPVVDNGELVGIISVTDILKAFIEQNQA